MHIFTRLILFFFAYPILAASPEPVYPDCFENVQRMAKEKLASLATERKLHLSEDFLWSDPAFRNYPAIYWQFSVSYCPRLETVEVVKDFLAEVGFNRHQMDRYFKRMIHLSDNPKYNAKLQTREYQIGREWNRIEYKLEDTKNSVLSIPFFAYGAAILMEAKSVVSVIYLGEYNKQALVAIPYHGLTLAKTDGPVHSCEEFKFAFPGVKENPVPATATLLTLPEADLAFCAVDLTGKTTKLKPVQWKWDEPLNNNTPLLVLGRGIGRNKDLKVTYDSSVECKTLAKDTDAILFVNKGYPSSWRLPTGCDTSEGDSGAAAFNRETMRWVGVVTTSPKLTFASLAGDVVDGKLAIMRLMDEASSIVPLNKIKTALEDKKASANERELQVINWLLSR